MRSSSYGTTTKVYRNTWIPKVILAGIVAFLVLIVGSCSMTTIPAGHVGVQVVFGKVAPTTLQPGVHLVNPLATIYEMDVRTKEDKEQATVPSKEGLSVGVDVSLLYRLSADKANEVFQTVGFNYVPVIVEPQARSVLRGVTAEYESRALYTADRAKIEAEMYKELEKLYAPRGIILEKVLLRDVRLPEQVRKAIDDKAAAEQDAERMKFVLLKEKQEAERKIIEAKGLADYQQQISNSLTERYIRWKQVDALYALARNPSSKFVIMGQGNMPMILNPDGK